MPTHKKGHDKDKYYHLAKDQGFRSRAAFKLIQINKRFDFLTKARVCIDLCAAPGGWCQVAAKNMPQGSIVLGVDLLPIKAIRNVKTIVGDITTAECRRSIVAELQGWQADVVLCDGAPNIGSSYAKDAYVQNELVLAALKCATDHLVAGGTFCTKVYRSIDYNALVWVLRQLFEDVQTIKPNSSRSQSSEIFLVCLRYTAPKFVDPKFVDPNHVFKEVADPGLQKVDVMHKKYEQSNKRHRTGYDESLGMLLTKSESISSFIASEEPIRVLTDINKLEFTEDCAKYKDHPSTNEELKICFQDLRILGKVDFKKILKWRQLMRATFKEKREESDDDVQKAAAAEPEMTEEEKVQADIKKFHALAVHAAKKEKKKTREQLAKDRIRQNYGMSNQSFGVDEDQELFSLGDGTTRAQLDAIAEVDLSAEDAADIMKIVDGEVGGDQNEDGGKFGARMRQVAAGANSGGADFDLTEAMENEMEDDYIRYLTAKAEKKNTNKEKKKKKDQNLNIDGDESRLPSTKRNQFLQESDQQIARLAAQDEELNTYVKLLTEKTQATNTKTKIKAEKAAKEAGKNPDFYKGRGGSDDDSSDDEEAAGRSGFGGYGYSSDDDSDDASDDAAEAARSIAKGRKAPKGGDRKVVTRDVEPLSSKASKWFAHPIFNSALVDNEDDSDDDRITAGAGRHTADASDAGSEDEAARSSQQRKKSAAKEMDLLMPKSDKEKRKEARKKAEERANRKENRMKRKAGEEDFLEEEEGGVAKKTSKRGQADGEEEVSGGIDGHTRTAEVLEQRKLIKEGMGRAGGQNKLSNNKKQEDLGFEVVPSESLIGHDDAAAALLEVKDSRLYDSDHEMYDAHDKIQTLALGTMMLRNSKRKAMVDASYNRFAWNDPKGLPDWFMDDEMRHNKPQLPIPQALVDQIKSRYQITGTREIKKVAEAKARKRKRAETKLKAAKKQATVVAENSDMSDKMKLRAIAKAMKNGKVEKPGKVYVVTKKTSNASSGTSVGSSKKGTLKFVDKRLKGEKHMARKREKRSKKGGKKRH